MLSLKGFLYAIVTSSTFGLIPLFTVPLLHGGMNTPSILFYRFLIASVIMWLYSCFKRKSLKVDKKEFFTLAWLSLLYIGSAVFFVFLLFVFGKRHCNYDYVSLSRIRSAYNGIRF